MSGHKPFSGMKAKLSPEARERARKKTALLRAEMPLQELRTALDLSQAHLAEILRVDQPAVSRLERRADLMLGTLRRYIEAMGGTLELRACFPEGDVTIRGLGKIRALAKKGAKDEREGSGRRR